jgi:hypothetical protein
MIDRQRQIRLQQRPVKRGSAQGLRPPLIRAQRSALHRVIVAR